MNGGISHEHMGGLWHCFSDTSESCEICFHRPFIPISISFEQSLTCKTKVSKDPIAGVDVDGENYTIKLMRWGLSYHQTCHFAIVLSLFYPIFTLNLLMADGSISVWTATGEPGSSSFKTQDKHVCPDARCAPQSLRILGAVLWLGSTHRRSRRRRRLMARSFLRSGYLPSACPRRREYHWRRCHHRPHRRRCQQFRCHLPWQTQ